MFWAMWGFMLACNLIAPVIMILFGRRFMENPPKVRNGWYGYRTRRSGLSQDTWDFAHKYCGKLWYKCGMVMLPVSAAAMLFIMGKDENIVGIAGGIVCAVQTIILIGSIYPTEKALKNNFDKEGNRYSE